MDEPGAPQTVRRSVALGAAIGVIVAVATAGLVYGMIAIPMYALAQADPSGLDRPFFRTSITRVALPAGLLVGLGVGAVLGVWYRRGGHLPTDRTPF